MNTSKIHMFCIGHTKLSLKIPSSSYLIRTCRGYLKDDAHPNLISLDEVSEQLDYYYPYLGGTAGLFAVEELISNKMISFSPNDRIMIFQQAKFTHYIPSESKSENYKTAGLLPQSVADQLDLKEIFSGWQEQFLFPAPSFLAGKNNQATIAENYALCKNHNLSDFLNFFSEAIDLGVVSDKEFINCFNDNVFVPGGGCLGIMPVVFFVDLIKKLKLVSLTYLDKHRPCDSSKVGRIAASYCTERLSSHLLKLEMIKNHGVNPSKFYGEMQIVVPDGSDYVCGSSSVVKN